VIAILVPSKIFFVLFIYENNYDKSIRVGSNDFSRIEKGVGLLLTRIVIQKE
jgi:hypothetical protein